MGRSMPLEAGDSLPAFKLGIVVALVTSCLFDSVIIIQHIIHAT